MIRGAIQHFGQIRYDDAAVRIAFITSEREEVEPHALHAESTAAVIDRELRAWCANGGRDIFRRIHYPYASGLMADQINYGVRYIFEAYDTEIDADNTFVGVYNVDSRPAPEVLLEVAQRFASTGESVFQQLSRYRPASRGRSNAGEYVVACAFSVWQTRWSYLVERNRYLTSNALYRSHPARSGDDVAPPAHLLWRSPYSYTVGHGLFVRFREFCFLNFLPTQRPNEDAEFGFFLPFFGLAPCVLATPDIAETSESILTTIRQQASWITGPMLSLSYLRAATVLFDMSRFDLLRAVVYSLRCTLDAVFWILGPAILLASGLFYMSRWIETGDAGLWPVSIAVSGWSFYLFVPTIALFLSPSRPFGDISIRQFTIGLLSLPLCYLIHGLGGGLGLTHLSYARISGSISRKHKTER